MFRSLFCIYQMTGWSIIPFNHSNTTKQQHSKPFHSTAVTSDRTKSKKVFSCWRTQAPKAYSFCLSLKICNLFGLSVIKTAYHIDSNSNIWREKHQEPETEKRRKHERTDQNECMKRLNLCTHCSWKLKGRNSKKKNKGTNEIAKIDSQRYSLHIC